MPVGTRLLPLLVLCMSPQWSCRAILVEYATKLGEHVRPTRPYPRFYQKITFEADPSQHSGFLLVLRNGMEMSAENCQLLDDILLFELNGRNLSLACTHYLVHYADSPLTVRLVPALYQTLRDFVDVTVTAIRLGCGPFDRRFRRCAAQPFFCVPRRLFCDGVDNCGMNGDESNCTRPHKRIALAIVDSRSYKYLAVVMGSAAVVSGFAGLAALFLYRWYQRARRGYCSRYVKNVFGAKKEQSIVEAEETVALLTLGLKNLYIPLPTRPATHYNGLPYGTNRNL